jgi:hypothetical protein
MQAEEFVEERTTNRDREQSHKAGHAEVYVHGTHQVTQCEATDCDAETPEDRTQSRDKREASELGSTDEASGALQKVADRGDM